MTKNNIRANKPGTQVCSQVAYWKFIQTLDKEQLQARDDLGFGGLTKMNGVQIRQLFCKQIARQYDEQTRAFNINGTMLEITIEDVDHILGVPSEGAELVEVPQVIQADVDAPKDKDENKALQTTKAAFLTLNHLKRSIVSFQHDKVNLKGNQILLLLWYWEKFRVSHIDPSKDYIGRIVNDIKIPIEATKEYTTKDHSGTDANQPSNMDNTKAHTTEMADAKKKKDTSNSPIAPRVRTTGRVLTSTVQLNTNFVYPENPKNKQKATPAAPPPPNTFRKFTCTEEDEFLIDYINTSPHHHVMVRMEGLLLTREQLQPLTNRFLPDGEARYVIDEIIDTYIMHLEHKYLEESQALRRVKLEISKRQLEKGYISRITNQIAQNEQIFIPINRNKNHWYLVVVHVFMWSLHAEVHRTLEWMKVNHKIEADIFRRKLAAILVGSALNDNIKIPTYKK
uniref:Ubiquitin-like protease family profile domain-containing protein n=1 Tax=Oryza barthii TaxID=65489 RepID=A0A0D3G5X8_9ORYZ